jgi:hypothetical protein
VPGTIDRQRVPFCVALNARCPDVEYSIVPFGTDALFLVFPSTSYWASFKNQSFDVFELRKDNDPGDRDEQREKRRDCVRKQTWKNLVKVAGHRF